MLVIKLDFKSERDCQWRKNRCRWKEKIGWSVQDFCPLHVGHRQFLTCFFLCMWLKGDHLKRLSRDFGSRQRRLLADSCTRFGLLRPVTLYILASWQTVGRDVSGLQAVGRDALCARLGGRQRRNLADCCTMSGPTGPIAFVRSCTSVGCRQRRLQSNVRKV